MREDFRFFDNRQKYLLFVTTTNEKNIVGSNISKIIEKLRPKKPGLKIFDAGLGDGTLLMSVLRKCHNKFPTIPFLISGKEISLEDVRLTIEKLPDRFIEHPNMVFVVSNLHYNEAANLSSSDETKNNKINWEIVKLKGNSSFEYSEQIAELDNVLEKNWQVERHPTSGNPTYKEPSVLIIYRDDHEFTLDKIIPQKNERKNYFDMIIASQPYRSRISVKKKVDYVVKPMIKALNKGGKLILIHSIGNDTGHKVLNKLWPEDNPFPSNAKDIVEYLKLNLSGNLIDRLNFKPPEVFKYNLRALPNEIENGISTSLIFSSWNAITYVGQISDDEIIKKEKEGNYIECIREAIKKNNGLWFNDEILEIENV